MSNFHLVRKITDFEHDIRVDGDFIVNDSVAIWVNFDEVLTLSVFRPVHGQKNLQVCHLECINGIFIRIMENMNALIDKVNASED